MMKGEKSQIMDGRKPLKPLVPFHNAYLAIKFLLWKFSLTQFVRQNIVYHRVIGKREQTDFSSLASVVVNNITEIGGTLNSEF